MSARVHQCLSLRVNRHWAVRSRLLRFLPEKFLLQDLAIAARFAVEQIGLALDRMFELAVVFAAAHPAANLGHRLGDHRLAVDEPLGRHIADGLVFLGMMDAQTQAGVEAGIVPFAKELNLFGSGQPGQVGDQAVGNEPAMGLGVHGRLLHVARVVLDFEQQMMEAAAIEIVFAMILDEKVERFAGFLAGLDQIAKPKEHPRPPETDFEHVVVVGARAKNGTGQGRASQHRLPSSNSRLALLGLASCRQGPAAKIVNLAELEVGRGGEDVLVLDRFAVMVQGVVQSFLGRSRFLKNAGADGSDST